MINAHAILPVRLKPIVLAVHLGCLTLLGGAPSVQAQSAANDATRDATLPAVRVSVDREAPGIITQSKVSQVGKQPVSVQDTPFGISVVDVAQAKETGALNVQDALVYNAGVYAGRYGFDTRGDWVAIRGLGSAAYIDGLRYLFGSYNNVRPEMYALERIEVLKGPSSVLYGQADLGGVVNVVSKRPSAEAKREVEVQLGSYNRKQIAADLTGSLSADGQWLYRLVALSRDSDTQVDHVHDNALLLMPSLTWKPAPGTEMTVLYTHQANDSVVSSQFLPSRGTIDEAPRGQIPSNRFAGEPGWDRYDTRKNELTFLLNQRVAPDWNLALNLRNTRSSSITREIYTQVGVVPDAAGNIPRTMHTADRATDVLASDFRLEGAFKLGPTSHKLAVGFDYQDAFWEEYNYSSNNNGGTFNVYNPVYGFVNTAALTFSDRPDNRIEQHGLYLMDHIEWGPWILSAAVRNDRAVNTVINLGTTPNSVVKNSATTGRLGVMYRLANGLSPYISYSEAFTPNLGTDGTSAANYLKPTTGKQHEVGLKYLAATGDTSGAFAWFDIEQTNRVVDGQTPGGVEQVGARTRGWEAELRHRAGPLEISGNYTALDAVNALTGQRLSAIAEKTASTWGQYWFGDNWRAGVGVRYLGSRTGAANAPVIPSVTLYDAMVGYTLGKWDFRLTGRNLADKQYISWCRGRNQDCGYGERRQVMLSANYSF